MSLELCVWVFMTYSAIYHGKIFDYNFYETADFVAHVDAGGNWYYHLMFGHLNLTTNVEHQKTIQGEKFLHFGVQVINSFTFLLIQQSATH